MFNILKSLQDYILVYNALSLVRIRWLIFLSEREWMGISSRPCFLPQPVPILPFSFNTAWSQSVTVLSLNLKYRNIWEIDNDIGKRLLYPSYFKTSSFSIISFVYNFDILILEALIFFTIFDFFNFIFFFMGGGNYGFSPFWVDKWHFRK